MKLIQQIGLYTFIAGMLLFTANVFIGSYRFEEQTIVAQLDATQDKIDTGDTIANGFKAALKELSFLGKKYNGEFDFISDLNQAITLYNKNITTELVTVNGITPSEIEALYSGVQKDGKIIYNEELLTTVLTDPAKKQKLIDGTNWMFEGQREYADLESFKNDLNLKLEEINSSIGKQYHISTEAWNLVNLTKAFNVGGSKTNVELWFFLTFGLIIIGGLAYNLPNIKLLGMAGIKNNGIQQTSISNKGWLAWIVLGYLVGFYLLLYFAPHYLNNNILLVDPVSNSLSGKPAGHWFLYGFIYCVSMTIMAVRMYIKYRHNNYQIFRTTVVWFFQIAFAFLIPELLVRFDKPWYDFKNAWPLDYDFFFAFNIDDLLANGTLGAFMFFWGIILTLIIIPVMAYFFGKRWYCSWVCGCGGLAETVGDPYRQNSSKTLLSWKVERYLVHSVLAFAIVMTLVTLYAYYSGATTIAGIDVYTIQKIYSFLIGSIFSGVIGTGFYPIFGNRTWCRFGCPLAAYMGIVQRFKSKFRITTNGGQCISCGNCSTYCEQGIDVRSYAQKGEDIIRASCVGCGVCSAVCPRGVLKLENSDAPKKVDGNPLIFENNIVKLNKDV